MKMNENIYCLRTYRIGANRNISRYLNSEKYALMISLYVLHKFDAVQSTAHWAPTVELPFPNDGEKLLNHK